MNLYQTQLLFWIDAVNLVITHPPQMEEQQLFKNDNTGSRRREAPVHIFIYKSKDLNKESRILDFNFSSNFLKLYFQITPGTSSIAIYKGL